MRAELHHLARLTLGLLRHAKGPLLMLRQFALVK